MRDSTGTDECWQGHKTEDAVIQKEQWTIRDIDEAGDSADRYKGLVNDRKNITPWMKPCRD